MRFFTLYLPAVLFVLTAFLLVVFPGPVDYLRSLLLDMKGYSYAVFVLLLVIATVFAPVTVMPAIPLASGIFGPFMTSILSIVGWTIGALLAFLIARYLGRPILEKFVSLGEIDRFAASLPENTRFLLIVLMRVATPVDILSYALGLTKGVRFWEYTLATIIGVSWFSFAFAYLGSAFLTGNTLLFVILGSVSLVIFLGAWYFLWRSRRKEFKSQKSKFKNKSEK